MVDGEYPVEFGAFVVELKGVRRVGTGGRGGGERVATTTAVGAINVSVLVI